MPSGNERIHNATRLKERRRELRRAGTRAEAILWTYLKRSQLHGRKFRRQHSIGPYVVDFYCLSERLAIELDGAVHADPARRDYDAERETYLQEQGVRLVRFENRAVVETPDLVLDAIAQQFGS